MVYEIVWTPKAAESFVENVEYLEENWTEREINNYCSNSRRKDNSLSKQPSIGNSRSKKHPNVRHTVLHKRVSLIYRVNQNTKESNCYYFGTLIGTLPN